MCSMNWGRGAFQGSWRWLSIFPSFFVVMSPVLLQVTFVMVTAVQPAQWRYASIHSAPFGGGVGNGRSRSEMARRNRPRQQRATIGRVDVLNNHVDPEDLRLEGNRGVVHDHRVQAANLLVLVVAVDGGLVDHGGELCPAQFAHCGRISEWTRSPRSALARAAERTAPGRNPPPSRVPAYGRKSRSRRHRTHRGMCVCRRSPCGLARLAWLGFGVAWSAERAGEVAWCGHRIGGALPARRDRARFLAI